METGCFYIPVLLFCKPLSNIDLRTISYPRSILCSIYTATCCRLTLSAYLYPLIKWYEILGTIRDSGMCDSWVFLSIRQPFSFAIYVIILKSHLCYWGYTAQRLQSVIDKVVFNCHNPSPTIWNFASIIRNSLVIRYTNKRIMTFSKIHQLIWIDTQVN